MRISDWSSDVCSSDLNRIAAILPDGCGRATEAPGDGGNGFPVPSLLPCHRETARLVRHQGKIPVVSRSRLHWSGRWATTPRFAYSLNLSMDVSAAMATPFARSEEHTSELQSLMRI